MSEVVVVVDAAALDRVEVSGEREVVPRPRLLLRARAEVDVAERLVELRPRRPGGDAPVQRERLVEPTPRRAELRPVLVDEPVARVRALGPVVVLLRVRVAAGGEVELAALELDPAVRAELLRRQLVHRLRVQLVGALRVAELGLEVREPRERRPRPVVLDEALVAPPRLLVPPFLEVEVGLESPALGRRAQGRRQLEGGLHSLEPVELEVDVRLQEAEIRPRPELLDPGVHRGLRLLELAEVAGHRGAAVEAVRDPRRAVRARGLLDEPLELLGDPCQVALVVSGHAARRGTGTRPGSPRRSATGSAASSG